MLADTVRASEFLFKNIKIFYSCLLIILLFSLSACLAENHLHQAIRYSEAAIMADDGKTISKHSEIAKIHALLVQNQKIFHRQIVFIWLLGL